VNTSRLASFGRPAPIAPDLQVKLPGSAQADSANARRTLSLLTAALPEASEALAARIASMSGLSRLLKGDGARTMSSLFAPLSALVRPPTRPDTDASADPAASLAVLSVPPTWAKAARAC
jgi:hypothetical protein